MRSALSSRLIMATGACVMLLASPVFAQDAPQATHQSWFRMFLWNDDLIGLLIIWVLLMLSAISLGFMIKLSMDNRRAVLIPEETHHNIETLLAEKRYREAIEYAGADPSYLGKVVNSGLGEAANGYGAMERAIEEMGDVETTRLLRPIEFLNVLGNIAPMLGLFGTVYGMILAFQKLVESGGKPDPGKLAAGISTALVTTFWGLVVAVPALTAYAIVRNRVDAITAEGLVLAEQLIEPFKPAGRKAAGAGGASPRPRVAPQAVDTL